MIDYTVWVGNQLRAHFSHFSQILSGGSLAIFGIWIDFLSTDS